MLDQYGLSKKVDALSEEAKADLVQALKNAENKVTVSTIVSQWREILIVILIASALILYWRMNSAQTALKTKEETFNRLEKIDKIDSTLKGVEDNQKNLYPQIDANIQGIEQTRAQINALSKKIDLIGRPVYREQARSLTVDQLSEELNKLGYSNVVKGNLAEGK